MNQELVCPPGNYDDATGEKKEASGRSGEKFSDLGSSPRMELREMSFPTITFTIP